jgi:hypothetical protein
MLLVFVRNLDWFFRTLDRFVSYWRLVFRIWIRFVVIGGGFSRNGFSKKKKLTDIGFVDSWWIPFVDRIFKGFGQLDFGSFSFSDIEQIDGINQLLVQM